MKFIEKNKVLLMKNVIKYEKTLYNSEIDQVIGDLVKFAGEKGIKTNRVLTITKGLNFETGKQRLVMDFYLELDQPTKGNNKYLFLDNYCLEDCVFSKFKGPSQNASMATREVNGFIKKNGLNPVSPIHQVMFFDKKAKKKQNKNEVNIEVYVKVE